MSQNYVTQKAKWMPCPSDVNAEFPGLAYIYPLDELIIVEARDALHDVIGVRERIAYTIFNNKGQKVFVAVRNKKWKRFTLKIYNHYGNEVIEVIRPFHLFWNRVLVWAPAGHLAGSVKQHFHNKYRVKNENGHDVLFIRNTELCKLAYNIRYVCGVDPIGVIRKQCPAADSLKVNNYGVTFPVQLNVLDKAVLLGACFLIGCLKYKSWSNCIL